MTAFSFSRKFLALLLVFSLVLFGPGTISSQAAPTTPTFTVNTDADYNPGANDSACASGPSGTCGLREAIQEANALTGTKLINFSSDMAGQVIHLNSTYGGPLTLTGDHITISGYSLSSYVTLDAWNLSANSNLFEVQGNYNTIQSLKLWGWWPDATRNPDQDHGHGVRIYDSTNGGNAHNNYLNTLFIYNFEHDGVLISGDSGGGGNYNQVLYSLIGASGSDVTSCYYQGNGGEGVEIANGASTNFIAENTIICNVNSGVWLDGETGGTISETEIEENKIGTNGTLDLGNGLAGIADFNTHNTLINFNVISGNGNDGIWIKGSISGSIGGNKIGVDEDGNTAIPNDYDGIVFTDGANNCNVGSQTLVARRNIFSGNLRCGVQIDSGAHNIYLDGNYIGLGGSDGMVDIPNGLAGVCLFNATNSSLSSPDASVNQYISGNTREGVYTTNSSIEINPATYIGVAGDGSTPAGNMLEGIKLDTGTTGSVVHPGKVQYNGAAGIAILGDSSTGNDLKPLLIGSNNGLPIDLGDDGHTANGSHSPPGPNNWIGYPEVNLTIAGGFTGIACTGCLVRFYEPILDPVDTYGGGTYLPDLDLYADSPTGDFSFTFPVGLEAVSMIACDGTSHDCSEMSPSVTNTTKYLFLPLIRRQ
jgi:CSLREA domain-containing protein